MGAAIELASPKPQPATRIAFGGAVDLSRYTTGGDGFCALHFAADTLGSFGVEVYQATRFSVDDIRDGSGGLCMGWLRDRATGRLIAGFASVRELAYCEV